MAGDVVGDLGLDQDSDAFELGYRGPEERMERVRAYISYFYLSSASVPPPVFTFTHQNQGLTYAIDAPLPSPVDCRLDHKQT